MLLETGSEARFQVRAVEGVALAKSRDPERLILDGQQRLTSLTQILKRTEPVTTRDEKKRDSQVDLCRIETLNLTALTPGSRG